MPSIPQSLLWISLVVLWLFVLVPMLISKRDAVRRTSDVALATRVLNSGGGRSADQARWSGCRPSQRPRLAAEEDKHDDDLDDVDDSEDVEPSRVVTVAAAVVDRGDELPTSSTSTSADARRRSRCR